MVKCHRSKKSHAKVLHVVRFCLMNLFHPLVVVNCYWQSSSGCRPVPSHVLWVVLQAGDELLHFFALKADLVDGRKQREPVDRSGRWDFVAGCVGVFELVTDEGQRAFLMTLTKVFSLLPDSISAQGGYVRIYAGNHRMSPYCTWLWKQKAVSL